jgi:hypothetical protein
MKHQLMAIDPGASGGLAWIDADLGIHCMKMPATRGDILQALRSTKIAYQIDTVFIEDVGGFAGVPMPGHAMFNFGANFGFLNGVLMTLGLRVELVRPQKWQKEFSLGTVKTSGGKGLWKNKLKARAQELFPTADVTLATSDALLILEYGRRQNF